MMEIRSLTSIGSAEGKGFELTHVTAMLPVADYVAGFRNIEKFLGLCKQCPKFGQSWTCPPCEFDVKAFVDNFSARNACFVATNLVRVQTANPVDTRTMCEFR